jgi:hypothetical protein
VEITKRQREILSIMVDHQEEEEGELVRSTPGGWWLGETPIAARTGFWLLRNLLITEDTYSDEKMQRYTANEYAERALKEPGFDWRNEVDPCLTEPCLEIPLSSAL